MGRQDFMRDLYAKVQGFEAHWNKCQRLMPNDFPNELGEAEWWDQWDSYCKYVPDESLEAKDGD